MSVATLAVPAAQPSPRLAVRPLTAESFAAYGQVIELADGARRITINDGTCVRHHDLARPTATAPGAVGLSLFDTDATPGPVALRLLERHGLGSQSFTPFGTALRMLVVVADAGIAPDRLAPGHLRAFVSNGRQGIQMNAGVWHHPLISLQAGTWLVVDRIAPETDCDVVPIHDWRILCAP